MNPSVFAIRGKIDPHLQFHITTNWGSYIYIYIIQVKGKLLFISERLQVGELAVWSKDFCRRSVEEPKSCRQQSLLQIASSQKFVLEPRGLSKCTYIDRFLYCEYAWLANSRACTRQQYLHFAWKNVFWSGSSWRLGYLNTMPWVGFENPTPDWFLKRYYQKPTKSCKILEVFPHLAIWKVIWIMVYRYYYPTLLWCSIFLGGEPRMKAWTTSCHPKVEAMGHEVWWLPPPRENK